jgi:hypothetical protein
MNRLCLVGLALCCAAALGCHGTTTTARQTVTPNAAGGRTLNMAQLDAIGTPSLRPAQPRSPIAETESA